MATKKIEEVVKRGRGRPRKPVPKPENRGGHREGAGRKCKSPEEGRRVHMGLNVSPTTKAQCAVLREKGINLSNEFEKMIGRLAKVLCG